MTTDHEVASPLDALFGRERGACARAARLRYAIRPGERVLLLGPHHPLLADALRRADHTLVVAPEPAMLRDAGFDHVVVEERPFDRDGRLDRALGALAPGGCFHFRLAAERSGSGPSLAESWRFTFAEERALDAGGVFLAGAIPGLESVVTVRRPSPGLPAAPSEPLPLALLYDHPRWLKDTHEKLRLLLAAAGFRLRELDDTELLLRGSTAPKVHALERMIGDDVLRVTMNRRVGQDESLERKMRLLFDGEDDPERRRAAEATMRTALRGFDVILASLQPRLFVCVNGTTTLSWAGSQAARRRRVGTLALENSFLKDRFFLENVTGGVGNVHSLSRFRFDWLRHAALEPGEEEALDAYFAHRDTSSSFDGMIRQGAEVGADVVRRRLGIPRERRIALLLGQVAFDSVVTLDNPHFESSYDFIRATVDVFAGLPGWHLVVRLHPKEAHEGDDCTAERLALDGPLPDNVSLVRAQELNTYSIMDACDFGITINSQSGLELIARGRPCVTAGDAFYGNKGFTRDLSDRALLAPLIRSVTERPALSDSERTLARRFLFHLVHRFTLPYGLDGLLSGLADKLAEIRLLPPTRAASIRPAKRRRLAPLVSIVVVVETGGASLRRTLAAMLRQDLSPDGLDVRLAAPRGVDRRALTDFGSLEPAVDGGDAGALGEAVSASLLAARADAVVLVSDRLGAEPDAARNLLAEVTATSGVVVGLPLSAGRLSASWLDLAAAWTRLHRGLVPINPGDVAAVAAAGTGVLAAPRALLLRVGPARDAASMREIELDVCARAGRGVPLRVERRPGFRAYIPESLEEMGRARAAEGRQRARAAVRSGSASLLGLPGDVAMADAAVALGTGGRPADELAAGVRQAIEHVEARFPTPVAAGEGASSIAQRLAPLVDRYLEARLYDGVREALAAAPAPSA